MLAGRERCRPALADRREPRLRRPSSAIWDGQWYWIVAVHGYPDRRCRSTDAGHVAENAGRSCPCYPYRRAALVALARLPWTGRRRSSSRSSSRLARALPVLYRMHARCAADARHRDVRGRAVLAVGAARRRSSRSATPSRCCLLWLFLALLLLLQRRYVLAVSRSIAAHGAHPAERCSRSRSLLGLHVHPPLVVTRRRDPFPLRDDRAHRRRRALAARRRASPGRSSPGSVTGDAGGVHRHRARLAAQLATSAYQRPPAVRRRGSQGAEFWFGAGALGPATGYVVVGVLVVVGVRRAAAVRAARCGGSASTCGSGCASYALYLLAVFFPQSSTFRLLVPLSPLLGALARCRGRRVVPGGARASLGIAGQWWWIYNMYALGNTDWQIP